MLKIARKQGLFFSAISAIAIIYLLKRFCKKNNILNKLYDLNGWGFNLPITFFKKYRKVKLPIIDKYITVNLSDEELEEKFVQTCNAVKIYKNKLKFDEWVYLYGLYKQIKMGNIEYNNNEQSGCNNDKNNKINELKLNKNDFIENEKINSWKHCYNVDKKVCKFLYIEYFNKSFPNVIESLNNNLSFDLSKGISKMKPIKENYESENKIDGTNNNLCDIFCNNVVFKNIEYIKKTLDNYPYIINQRNSDGLTALHYACDRGYLEIVKFLVDKGADINKEDSYGDTVLHTAAYSDKKEIIDYLISVGADINKKNSDGLTIDSILNQN